ncbi:MAG: ABC transporter permease, partial [Ktedonobacteraceae bacterium]
MSASLKKPLADILQRKGRALLVVLAIFIGVFGLTCINMTEDALFSAFTFSISSQVNQPDIVLAVDKLDPALLPALKSVANVKMIQYETTFETLWHVERAPGYTPIKIISYPDLHHVSLTPFELVSGRYPQTGEIVLEFGDKGIQDVQIGDQITVDTSQGRAQIRVVGFARTQGVNPAVTDKAQGYMSDDGIQQLAGFATPDHPNHPTRLHSVAVKVTTIREVDRTARALQLLLQSHQVTVQLTAFPDSGTLPLQQFDGIFALLRLLVFVAMGISALLIFNTVTTLITEQTAIIGTMKALGGTRGRIMRSYLLTMGIYCLLATVPGLLLGIEAGFLLASLIAASVPISLGPFALPAQIIPFALAIGCGMPLLAALLPIWNGTRITVREALSAYGIHAETEPQHGILARFHLSWPSQTVWLGLRSLFRKRWRVALLLLTLSSAGMSFLIVRTVATSINNSVGSAYSRLD